MVSPPARAATNARFAEPSPLVHQLLAFRNSSIGPRSRIAIAAKHPRCSCLMLASSDALERQTSVEPPEGTKSHLKNLIELADAQRCAGEMSVPVVLTVEDDEQVRVLAESILQDSGHETLSATNVDEALALLRSDQTIDVLFTDIELSNALQGGLDLAQEGVRLRPRIHVVYTSGREVTDGMRALFVERSLYLRKPYLAAQLTAAVGALLGSS
jgi:CheY-like chemotaxis protein